MALTIKHIFQSLQPDGTDDTVVQPSDWNDDHEITGTIENTPIGSETPSTGAFTTLSASGNVTLGDATTDTLNVGNGGIVKDASGNVGIGTGASALPVRFNVVGASNGLQLRIGGDSVNSDRNLELSSYQVSSVNNVGHRFNAPGNAGVAGTIAFAIHGTDKQTFNSNGVGVGVFPTARNNTSFQIVDGIGFPATQVASTDANTLDDYREASYTATATGLTTAPTGTVEFVRVGRKVTAQIPAISGTSNATTFTLTGGPTTMRPTAARVVPCRVQDNGGAIVWGMASIGTDGTITLSKDANTGAFTASGTKATAACQISYII